MPSPPESPNSAGETLVRRAAPDDLPEVIRIWHEGWQDAHLGHVPEGLLQYRTPAHFAALAAERQAAMWVAVSTGAVSGFVVVRGDEIEHLYVDRPHRGSGVAVNLLRTGETQVRLAGHLRAWLAVVAGNQRARAFYARLGWRDVGPMAYHAQTADGSLAVPTHRYERDLSMHALF